MVTGMVWVAIPGEETVTLAGYSPGTTDAEADGFTATVRVAGVVPEAGVTVRRLDAWTVNGRLAPTLLTCTDCEAAGVRKRNAAGETAMAGGAATARVTGTLSWAPVATLVKIILP